MNTDHELQALFRAERAVRPAELAIEHGWHRLALDLAANVAPAPVAMGAVKLNSWLISKWLAAGFAVGAVGLGASAQLLSPAPTPGRGNAPAIAVRAQRVAEPRASATTEAEGEAAPSAPSAATSGRELHATAPPSECLWARHVRRRAASDHTRQGRARRASHESGECVALRARGELPQRRFAVEREALQILVACERGPKDEALARAFATRHPSSPLVERLLGACRPSVDSFELVKWQSPPLGNGWLNRAKENGNDERMGRVRNLRVFGALGRLLGQKLERCGGRLRGRPGEQYGWRTREQRRRRTGEQRGRRPRQRSRAAHPLSATAPRVAHPARVSVAPATARARPVAQARRCKPVSSLASGPAMSKTSSSRTTPTRWSHDR